MHENIFQLTEPEKQLCKVLFYGVGLSTLILSTRTEGANLKDDILYLGFEQVEYMEFPRYWKGANFSQKHGQELNEFCRTVGIFDRWLNQMRDEDYAKFELDKDRLFGNSLEGYALYTANPYYGNAINIIAKAHFITSNLSDVLPGEYF